MTHFAHRAAKGPKISRYFSTAREMVCLPRGARGRLLQHGQTFTSFGSFNRTRSRARTTQHAGQGISARIVTKSPARAGPPTLTHRAGIAPPQAEGDWLRDRKSTRLNSSHVS